MREDFVTACGSWNEKVAFYLHRTSASNADLDYDQILDDDTYSKMADEAGEEQHCRYPTATSDGYVDPRP